jgi:prophage antirepressor-like protein
MEIVKAFNENNLHTEIVIKGTFQEPLFRASDIAEVLEMGNIRSTIQNFDKTEKDVHTMDTLGGSQQVTFLTEKGLYKILFKSRKPIAEKFQNWVCTVIKEIRLNGMYYLQKKMENEMKSLENVKNKEMEEKIVKEKENMLLKEYCNSGPLVYIIKVKSFPNGEYVVKIGHSTIGIQNRYNEHKKNYEECILMNCVSVDKSKDFERFLHQHNSIRLNKVNDLIGHEHENELFLIGKELTYEMISSIINDNKNNFNYNIGELMKENELLKYKLENNQNNLNNEILNELNNTIKILSNKVDNMEKTNKEIINKINCNNIKTTTNFNTPLPSLGPRLQKINPDNFQLVKVYESVSEAMKENSQIKRPSINKAIENNTIYCGYRWLFVNRDIDPTIIETVPCTKITKVQNLGYIAKLNADKTEIINVYIDRKTAAKSNGYSSSSALDNTVKKMTISNGFYYKLYDDCDDLLRIHFEQTRTIPLLYKNGLGQYDNENRLIKEFICKYDCMKQLHMSDKTLTKAIEKNIPYNGHYYKELGSKLFC